MRYLICAIYPFELHQRIMLIDGTSSQVVAISSISDLATTIVDMCRKYNVSNVILEGNRIYAKEISYSIEDLDASLNVKINIE